MAFLFKRNPKTPSELVRALNDNIVKFDAASDRKKVQDEAARLLTQMRLVLHGDEDMEPQPDLIAQLAHDIYQTDLLYYLILNLHYLEFDSRKDVSTLFSTLLRRQIGNRSPTVDYLLGKPKIITALIKGPEVPESCLITGAILRDCIKFEALTKMVLQDPAVWKLFDFSSKGTFENMTDSFQTLSDLLSVHKKLAAEWLVNNNDHFTLQINKLISSNNYVTKRQSIKLLSNLILTRQNSQFMNQYVNSAQNLKLVMILLSDKSKNIQLESFNVFKVFVANPKKSKTVLDILIKNRDKLIIFFDNFNFAERKDDPQFKEEKEFVVQQITDLPKIVTTPSGTSGTNSGTTTPGGKI
ncbi:HYM1 [Cyberlindnera jadinii]|uniref:HYM1 protein n=1 Tax=Cyberlindnera jadinii (strain ATCC 18201 / CBS 1600 / BCRC 20928 / JCM 3617 / NBRC 0987 / NRRL Y-1542) TaxID=983966 RepID=A0A0H5C2M0_CYBJN|nr:Mo25-like protein [Cyberlindnera jadinii NRRL Y-1542]ODV72887.1 Mo25-like protein [Cyberlindnera jadinii NRRL Y-1542]CEP22098.1 HYM1 [Cyberlindnera jadinii]